MVWDDASVQGVLTTLASQMQIKLRDFMPAFFIAIAGSTQSTPVMQAMVTLGADLTYARLRHALSVLGGVSKKETSEWQKLDTQLQLAEKPATSDDSEKNLPPVS